MDNRTSNRDYAAQITYAMCPVYVAAGRWLTHEDINCGHTCQRIAHDDKRRIDWLC